VRLAALRGEKAVTSHKQCGPGWLGLDRIYFLASLRRRFTWTYADKSNPPQKHRGTLNLQVLS